MKDPINEPLEYTFSPEMSKRMTRALMPRKVREDHDNARPE